MGLILAAVATALWAVALAAGLTTAPEDGVNIGAAVLGLLAIPLSIGTSITLLVSWRAEAAAGRAHHPVGRRIGAGLAAASIASLAGSLVIGPMTETVEQAVVAGVVLLAGITTFVVSSALLVLPRTRHS